MAFCLTKRQKRLIKKYMPIVHKIENLMPYMKGCSDEQLQAKTEEFKARLCSGATLDDLLVEAFAVVRESAYRVLGLEPYPEQLLGAIVLYQGCIAEMKTGEGKTLVAAMPAYLMALAGKGVHVITVNDYLAQRDADEIGQIHKFLGLSVGCVLTEMKPAERKKMYDCDITYITNNELGFDYLRDNMAKTESGCVQRGLFYCIIDEVDSILIDEARTPLIISSGSDQVSPSYALCNYMAQKLEKGTSSGSITKADILAGKSVIETGDFIVDEKEKTVHLTGDGIHKVETFFNLKNYADASNNELQHGMLNALKALYLMHRNKDYIVKNGEVIIVDEFTGRLMPGRRYNDGLHQAIEAKEGVDIQGDSVTMATITLQNFFNKYDRKSGMTGTANTEAQEFKDIYGMRVVVIPTHEIMIREDLEDVVYKTKDEKYRAVVQAVCDAYEKGQPVLVGTVSIEVSELISKKLGVLGIPHTVLNAKYHEKEAEIISHAGEPYSVTIATNMAGRGTDIKLTDESVNSGGLFVIGTERHESRRIDNQLRGRSGRQGDPGKSQFFISLEDDVMRLFGSERMILLFNNMGISMDEPIQHKALSKTIESAQKRIEQNNFAIRKHLVEYETVNNQQRDLVYADRRNLLSSKESLEMGHGLVESVCHGLISQYCLTNRPRDWDWDGIERDIAYITDIGFKVRRAKSRKELYQKLYTNLRAQYDVKYDLHPDEMLTVTKLFMIQAIDKKWIDHIQNIEHLRQDVSLIGYGQKDPVIEYKRSAYDMFDKLLYDIQKLALRMILHVTIQPIESDPRETVKVDVSGNGVDTVTSSLDQDLVLSN